MSNICRSPYADLVFNRIVANDEVLSKNVTSVLSAGVFNRMPEIYPRTKQALLNEGFTLEEINAKKPAYKKDVPERFENADVIIGMTKNQRRYVPSFARKKYIPLSQAAGHKYKTIKDPFTLKSEDEYNGYMKRIKAYLEEYAAILKKQFIENAYN
jgi:protein-tyrosine-phosphatase